MRRRRKSVKYVGKSKTVAVLLAVFFGLFSWLYTYKADSWKFWMNLALAIITGGAWGGVAWVWAIVNQASRPVDFYDEYYDLVV